MVRAGEQQATTLVLENGALELVVRADLGGRIDQFLDKATGRDWVWHPPDYTSATGSAIGRELALGAGFDDHWQGGWDEVFPNDMAQSVQGRSLVDHGELWSQPWRLMQQSSRGLTLHYTCQTVPIAVDKSITLHATEPAVQIEYRLHNRSDQPIPFLLKLHAAIAIAESDQILLPDCDIQPVTLDFSKIIGRDQITRFPQAFAADGAEVDLGAIPSRTSQLQEFYYASRLATGECGIQDRQNNRTLQMQFDLADFPYVWMFQSYGGWRDHYVLVMEPCTTMPYDLELALQNGTAAMILPGQVQHRRLTIRLT